MHIYSNKLKIVFLLLNQVTRSPYSVTFKLIHQLIVIS